MTDEKKEGPGERERPALGGMESEVEVFVGWLRRYSTPLLIGVGILLVGLLCFRWFQRSQTARRESAVDALYAAADVNGYRAVVDQYSGTPSAVIAALGVARSLYEEGAYDRAREAYGRFVDRYPDHPMAVPARFCMALCLEASGDIQTAQTEYASWVSAHPDHYLAPAARLGRGRCAALAGRWEEARAAYEELLVAPDVDSTWVRQAELALERVRMELRRRDSAAPATPAAG